ncbi:DUF1320 domain-containing protein [Microvirga sp. c23x22]|uniref:DUF1320 domain-containing protein n=2 Tax=Microvirga terricola TaxID=2719797 RepID=A0ABX0V6F1_9HYPH|nr:DUF1320 domain-containing protein [Microvirga terricola]
MAYRYASVEDMVARFGEGEMLRLSVADGDLPDSILPERIEKALTDATDLIDSYLRSRYTVPLAPVPEAILRAACHLARYDLSNSGDKTPTEAMKDSRAEIIAWLTKLSKGDASLEGATPIATAGGARTSDRPVMFGHHQLRGW